MSINISFDTGYLSQEEGVGLTALLSAVQPSLLTAEAAREQQRRQADAILPPAATTLPEATGPNVVTPPAEEPKAKRGRKPKEEAPANISTTPENRVDPENPEDAKQDAADEAAEADAGRDPEQPVTVEDLKAAMSAYVTKHGMDAVQADGVQIFKSALGEPPAGNPHWKMSLVAAAGPDALRKAVTAWQDATAGEKRFGA